MFGTRQSTRTRRVLVRSSLFLLAMSFDAGGQGADPRAVAEAIVRDVGRDAQHKVLTATVLAHAQESLDRAMRMRQAHDGSHAIAADGVALEWALAARDLVRAANAEARAVEVRRSVRDTQAQMDRLQEQVDEGIARVGRLNAEIERAEHGTPLNRIAIERHDEAPASSAAHSPKSPPKTRLLPSVDGGVAP